MDQSQKKWIGIEQVVAFLRNRRSYPEGTKDVVPIETHKSWVFLTDRYAYKMKKPIRYNSIDFRALDARCADCEAEIRLNRRLAGDVYIDVVSLNSDAKGHLSLGGRGLPIDCLVRMKRLPADRMMSHLILNHCLTHADVLAVAAKLSTFYRGSKSVIEDPSEYRAHLQRELSLSFDAFADPGLGLGSARVAQLHDQCQRFLDEDGHLLDQRVHAGRIVDGHGDLRAEHVCILPEPVIFDCLEFDDQLRVVDPVDELSFLSLECERLGDEVVGPTLLAEYCRLTGDDVPEYLLGFYRLYRATMWARLAAWRARELEHGQRSKWLDRLNTYLRIAESSASRMSHSSKTMRTMHDPRPPRDQGASSSTIEPPE